MSPLTIYKASAGSGKTFMLTMGYLELLFRNPLSYRHILAVTFTNKAAREMKLRILDQLHEFSVLHGDKSPEALKILAKSTGLDRERLILTSRELLVRILNDYSRFSVGTIDRFFQGVIRAFTREIGLQAGFSLELDRDRILGEAIDRMFLELGDDPELLQWMLRLAESRIEASRGWNFRKDIVSLGEELFREEYQQVMLNHGAGIGRDRLKAFMKQLDEMDSGTREEITRMSQDVIEAIDRAGYRDAKFHGASRSPVNYFYQASAGERTALTDGQKKSMGDLSRWISNSESDQGKIALIQGTLMPALHAIYDKTVMLNSVDAVREYVFTLGILNDISEKILDITDEKNLFLLSDASRFLKGLIGENPVPFIYEKTGSFIDHIMLDEFQDTSVFQWENFRPLLEHTLSTGKENIIVGDVKQSIYRWRNSDWKILAGSVGNAFPGHLVREEPLDTNWRSEEMIIRFNNTLFARAPEMVRQLIGNEAGEGSHSEGETEKWDELFRVAYNEVVQKIPEHVTGSGGYVRGEVLAEEGSRLKDIALEKIPGWIRELQDAGFRAGDIAILVRTNKEGADVAKKLMSVVREGQHDGYNYNFVSNESLFLVNSVSVRFIVSLLKYLQDDSDALNNISLRYYLHLQKYEEPDSTDAFRPGLAPEEVLGKEFMGQMLTLKRKPLFEMVETIIDLFCLDSRITDLPYIQAFQEVILELQQDEPGSLHDFIRYWQEFGSRKSIKVSEGQDAIRIITIHKAKGLQYRAVVLPFCDWDLTTSSSGFSDTVLWCNTAGTPFETIPVAPVKFRKNLRETVFADYYLQELVMGYVDSLNILYVALTRAEEAMIIGLPAPDDAGKIKRSGQLVMAAVASAGQGGHPLQMEIEQVVTDKGFEVGALNSTGAEETATRESWYIDQYPVRFRNEQLRLRLKSTDYFIGTEERDDHLNFGNLMHEIFGMIRSAGDVDESVKKFLREGLLNKTQADKLREMIMEKLAFPEVGEWFTGNMEVINEKDIISAGKIYRPDRVMRKGERTIVTDYKFGDQEPASHERQVQKYGALLEEMGYPGVEGYIWYVMLNKVVKVI